MAKPWTDAPLHDCADGTKGPVTPVLSDPDDLGCDVEQMRCCACGSRWYEDDPRKVVRAWWSAGAYEGKCAAEGAP